MTGRPTRRRRAVALALVISLTVTACAARDASPQTRQTEQGTVPASLPLVSTDETVAPASSSPAESTTTTTMTPRETLPPDPYRTWIATAGDHVTGLRAYDEPGGSLLSLPFFVPNPHQFGGPLTLMVTEGEPGDEWVRVQLPVRPNGQQGWIRTQDYTLSHTRIRAEVDLSDRRVVVYDGDQVIAETEAVIGTDATPTPVGTFYIAAKKENGEDEYFLGPWALVLSSFSEVLETFSGGLPVIAVHGTHRPEQIGQSLSNGCIRVPNDVIEFLAEHVPVGAPVTIGF